MPRPRLLLLSVPVLLIGLAAPAAAAPPTPAATAGSAPTAGSLPVPEPTPVGRPNGPWPPSKVLAADPAEVTAPAATAAAGPACPAAGYGVRSAAPGTGKTVALTFDDGPGPNTQQILSILQAHGVAATFFNIGLNETVRPRDVRSMQAAGYALGNHTWDHPQMPTLTAGQQASQLDRATTQQASLVGRAPCLFRPPYGEYNSTTLTLAQQRGMTVWNWSVDTEDWKAGTSTDQSWVNRIITRAQAGGSQQHPVILMHNPPTGLPATVAALPAIIKFYADRGYTFVDLHGRTGQRPAPGDASTAAGEQLTVRGTNGALYQRTGSGGGWTGFTSLGGALVGGPATIAQTSTLSSSFVTGTDSGVRQRSRPDAGGGSWIELGGAATSKPAAARSPSGSVTVAIRGGNGAIYLRGYVPGSGWGGWESLGGFLTSAPAIAVTADGRLTVAALGGDGALWIRNRGASWGSWRRLGGTATAEPALTASADGSRLVAAVRGTDGATWISVAGSDAATWSGWQSRGGAFSSGLAAAPRGSALVLVGYGTNGQLYRNVATGGGTATGWGGWVPVPSGPTSPVVTAAGG